MGLASLVIGCSRLVLGSAVSILCSVDTAVVLGGVLTASGQQEEGRLKHLYDGLIGTEDKGSFRAPLSLRGRSSLGSRCSMEGGSLLK